MKTYLDRGPRTGEEYYFIERPVWYSVHVDVPDGLVEAAQRVVRENTLLHNYLLRVYEAARNGTPLPEMSPEIKELLPSPTPEVLVEAAPAKKQKQKDSAVASS